MFIRGIRLFCILILSIAMFGCGKIDSNTEDKYEDMTQEQKDDIEYVKKTAIAVTKGQKLYFGVVAANVPRACKIYDEQATYLGKISGEDLILLESFSEDYGIYCYAVGDNVGYVDVPDISIREYYTYILKDANDNSTETTLVDEFLTAFDIKKVSDSTVATLQNKSALFLGDSIAFGACDEYSIYNCGGWAGRIGYYCNMSVRNNGVSQACISNKMVSQGSHCYIYNNLIKEANRTYDYVIMHGMYNDAGYGAPVGTPQGCASFDVSKADPSNFAQALELLFYTAKQQHPDAKLGFIVNFETRTGLKLDVYADMAIKICKDWGIPYLDLYTGSELGVLEDGTFIDLPDKLHPSSAGYDAIYNKVADWMAGL